MSNLSRRSFGAKAVELASAMVVTPALTWLGTASVAAASHAAAGPQSANSWESLTNASAPFQPVRIVDSDKMPWPAPIPPLNWQSKLLFEDKNTKARLHIINVPIGAPGYYLHYHTFHEWAYNISGDFTNNDSASPNEHMGTLQRYREGIFLSRPPFSLHGGELNREIFMQSQVGAIILIMEEGGETHTVEPGGPGYNPDFKSIKHWSNPRIIDTIGLMPWETHPAAPGIKAKWLVDDPALGFRATMYWVPAQWKGSQAPDFSRPYYYKQAHQFNFVLAGEMLIQPFSAPGRVTEALQANTYFLIDRAPMSMFGLPDGEVTKEGCVWLEVTYARGTQISDNVIEEPSYG